jgi:hypothetical protein
VSSRGNAQRLEIFSQEDQKIRRSSKDLGVRAAAIGLVPRLRAEGAANNETFCPSDLPVKKSGSVPYVFTLASD